MSTKERSNSIDELTQQALEEAQNAGLPPDWTVAFIGKVRRKKWFCPQKKGYDSLKKALCAAGVLISSTATPTTESSSNSPSILQQQDATSTSRTHLNNPPIQSDAPKKRGRPPSNTKKKTTNPSNKVAKRVVDSSTTMKSPSKVHQDEADDEEDEEEIVVEESIIPDCDPEPNPDTALDDMLRRKPPDNNKSGSSSSLIVHWDPHSSEGKLVGCLIRVYSAKDNQWNEGRIVLFDPITRKHKIRYNSSSSSSSIVGPDEWIYLHDSKVTTVQIGTRLVWAHVKGFAWWPGQVMETIGDNLPPQLTVRGSVLVEFYGTNNQISIIRDTDEFIRPFRKGHVDASMKKKCKKKLNQEAIDMALAEETLQEQLRMEASKHFAIQAFHIVNRYFASHLLGQRVQFHRNDVNYPYGETVRGFVRQYSPTTKKWLVDYVLQFAEDSSDDNMNNSPTHLQQQLLSSSTSSSNHVSSSSPTTPGNNIVSCYRGSGATLYPPSWINLLQKDCKLKVLSNNGKATKPPQQRKGGKQQPRMNSTVNTNSVLPSMDNLASFYKAIDDEDTITKDDRCILCLRDICYKTLLYPDQQGDGSLDSIKIGEQDIVLRCDMCHRLHHNSCLDSPLHIKSARKIYNLQRTAASMMETTTSSKNQPFLWTCDKCYRCEGCNKTDLLFGCKTYSKQVSIVSLLPPSTVENNNDAEPQNAPKNIVNDSYQPKLCSVCVVRYENDNYCPNCGKTFDDDSHYTSQKAKLWRRRHLKKSKKSSSLEDDDDDDDDVVGKFEDSYASNKGWGYDAGTMLTCDGCEKWVHAGCATLSKKEYESVTTKQHPIYGAKSGEFLCANCCRKKCDNFIQQMDMEDKMALFAIPVTEDVAPNYKDVISQPMDLQTLRSKFENNEFSLANYVWVKEMCELMVYNAMVYNSPNTKYWNEAKRFHTSCVEKIFSRANAPAAASYHTKYADGIAECVKVAQESLRNEKEREKKDVTAQKKDLVAGAEVASSVMNMMLSSVTTKPIDVSSCVPYMTIRLSPIDAHYSCWLDSCFSCGSTGAPDTMLFCVDCGEAYHSFCCGAPIFSMDNAAVTGWRCPNCKLCEISGLCPKDENQIVYCDLCDRAFDVKLLFPRIGAVPQGLFICDQCVSCSSCEPRKAKKRKCWSQDPKLCYRCGGNSFFTEVKVKPDEKIAKVKVKVKQPTRPEETLSIESEQLVTELRLKYEEELRWQTRNMWRVEYQSICDDAAKLYSLAKSKNHCEQIISAERCALRKVPNWLRSRAARWMRMASKKSFQNTHCDIGIIALVCKAKQAASFLAIGCNYFGVECSSLVKYWQRARSLLVPPNDSGVIWLPEDAVKLVGDHIMDESKWSFSLGDDGSLNDTSETVVQADESSVKEEIATDQDESDDKYLKSRDNLDFNVPRPLPLKGWDDQEVRKWTDQRTCCLCHTCGDDDGGLFHSLSLSPGSQLGHVGRLLPTGDGAWIHVSCALWSSEVWEGENGILHDVEKARHRGNKMKCFGCGRPGPTIGCSKSNCPVNFHFYCALYCGSVLTTTKQMFCKAHTDNASQLITPEEASHERMKSLRVASVNKTIAISDPLENNNSCIRIGSLVVHSLGVIEQKFTGFHSEHHITPPGYIATRIFWSFKRCLTRTLYILRVDRSSKGNPIYSIRDTKEPDAVIRGKSLDEAYNILMELVMKANSSVFSSPSNLISVKPVKRQKNDTFGLNAPQFFGFGIDAVRRALEGSPGAVVLAVPLSGNSLTYRFCFTRPKKEDITDLLRQRAAAASEKALENLSGCARTEGIIAVAKSGGAGRITRALVRSVDEDISEPVASGDRGVKGDEHTAGDTRNADKIQAMYLEMKSTPLENRLTTKRSHIHGWGLFTKCDVPKHSMIIEYMGETVRQAVADKRERAYEMSGLGSCYMFRLDANRIVDATMIGCMARFMNHCCQPNAYAKIITVEAEKVMEKKIVVFASRDILAGEEITYDYKFPVEDGSLKCTCGAPNCIGRMN